MALATRELELILIARDNASAVIARVGGAMVILGGIITAVGIKGIKELGEMTGEAIAFRQEIALAVTQADGLGATIENVSAIVNRVGKTLPVPFEELNEAMFDIFSTFTSDQLSSLEQAEDILRLFGESAVAGQAPVRDIARSTIAWINALDQPATVENVTRLLDIQFELIRKGAGTYEEFAGEVGKSIPAFAAASQSVETFGGIMAFLTKNGLNAAMAATSAARAAELMFSPKAISGLQEVGIAVEDSSGTFRAMEDIIRDLVPIMGNLTDAQQKIKFKEIFGTGRIQARRFFDLAIPNFAELEELIGDMEQSGGGVADAFAFMFDQPLSQMELFKNRWEALRRTIGEAFINNLQTIVFPALDRLFDWWDSLDQSLKDQIASWLAWGAAITVVIGILLVMIGVGLLFIALLKAFGDGAALLGLGKLALALGWVGLALAVIAGLAVLIIKNWDKILPFLKGIWDAISEAVSDFVDRHSDFFETVKDKAVEIWEKLLELGVAIWQRAVALWQWIWGGLLIFWERWGDDILGTLERVWGWIERMFLAALDVIIGILDFFIALFNGDWAGMWEAVKSIASAAWDYIKAAFGFWTEIISQIWRIVWDKVTDVATKAWDGIFKFFAGIWDSIASTASTIWNGILEFFVGIWNSIVGTASDTIEGTGGLLEFFQNLPANIITAVFDLAALLVTWIGGALVTMLIAIDDFVWTELIPFFADLPMNIINGIPGAATFLWDTGVSILKGMWNGIKWYYDNIFIPFWTSLLPAVLGAIGSVVSWLFATGLILLTGLLNGIKWYHNNLMMPWIRGIVGAIKTGIGGVASALWNIGYDLISGFWDGLKARWSSVMTWAADVVRNLSEAFKKALGISSPSKVFMEIGQSTIKGYQIGIENQRKPLSLAMARFNDQSNLNRFGPNLSQGINTTNNNENGNTFQFGDIISQADPDEIAQAMAWEIRLV